MTSTRHHLVLLVSVLVIRLGSTLAADGHGNARTASRFDYRLRMLRWFDHFLMSAGTELAPTRLDYRSPENGWRSTAEE